MSRYADGDELSAVARICLGWSDFVRSADRIRDSKVEGVAVEPSGDRATMTFRSDDGSTFELHWKREDAGWTYDQYRHYLERGGTPR